MPYGLQRIVECEQGAYQAWLGRCCFTQQGMSDVSHRIRWCEMHFRSAKAEAALCYC